MKTDHLIRTLAADAPMRQWPLGLAFAAAVSAGVVVSACYFFLELGVRANALESLSTLRFPFKFVVALALTVPALVACYRLARPNGSLGSWGQAFLVAPVFLATGVLVELSVVPPELWRERLIGQNSSWCLYLIPLMALAPLIAMVAVLRYGAVTQPRLASLAAGLAAAGLSATLYAAHCTDDSPLFLATWYSIATAIVVVASLLLVPRFLRW